VAGAAGKDFARFVPGCMELLTQLCGDQTQERLRGRAMEAIGLMARAVGKEAFMGYLQPSVETSMKLINDKSCDTQTFAMYLLRDLVSIESPENIQSLGDVFVPNIIKILKTTKTSETKLKSNPLLPKAPAVNIDYPDAFKGDDDDSDDDSDVEKGEDDDDDDDEEGIDIDSDPFEHDIGVDRITSVRTGECEKIVSGIDVLTEVCKYAPLAIEGHLKDVYPVIAERLVDNTDPTVRATALAAVADFLITASKISDFYLSEGKKRAAQKWSSWIAEQTETFGPEALWVVTNDDDPTVAKAGIEVLERLIDLSSENDNKAKLVSKTFIDDAHKLVKRVFKGRTTAQGFETDTTFDGIKAASAEEKTEDKKVAEGNEDDLPLLENAVQLMAAIGRRKGSRFERKFKKITPMLEGLVKDAQTYEAKAIAVTGYAEACLALGAAAQPYVVSLQPELTKIIDELRAKDATSSSAEGILTSGEQHLEWASLWTLGILASCSPLDVVSQYPKLIGLALERLKQPKGVGEQADLVWDNSIYCLCRLIRSNHQQVDMAAVLPVLLDSLPFKNDPSEIDVMADTIAFLWKERDKTMVRPDMLPRLLTAIARVLRSPLAEDDLRGLPRAELVTVCSEILREAQAQGQAQSLLEIMQPDDRKALEHALAQPPAGMAA